MDQQILETGQMFFNDLRTSVDHHPCQSVADKKITETVQCTDSYENFISNAVLIHA